MIENLLKNIKMQIEERGYFIQRFITEVIIFCNPPIGNKEYKKYISNFGDKLIFIKKSNETNLVDDYIPCLFYRKKESNKFLIYFHGNSENIFQIEHYGLDFRSYLNMNIILVEYPGYFLKSNNSYDPNIFLENSLIVYDWIKSTFKALDNQIFVCGRSLGTSPSIYLSSKRNPKALFLISAFTSIKNIGSDKHLSMFVEKIFKSIDYIENVKCPILFIHGKQDKLIESKHSEKLYEIVKNKNIITDIKILSQNKNHNNLDLKKDIIDNIIEFCSENKLFNDENIINNKDIINDIDLYKTPLKIKKLIEALIFDIKEFEIIEKREKNNVSFLMNLNMDRIAAINNSNISVYNDCYLINYEIKLNEIKKSEVEIRSLYQSKNGNLICATEEGDVFIFKINKRDFELIKILSFEEEIYKIREFYDDNICLLSKNSIKLFDQNFTKNIANYPNNKTFTNFCLFQKNRVALIKNKLIYVVQFEKNNNDINIIEEIKINNKISVDTIVGTEKYLIIGGTRMIYFYDVKNNYESKVEKLPQNEQTFEKVTFISKIHEQFLLGATNEGSILQIIINDDDSIIINKKFINNINISSILMIDYKILLISGNDHIYILSNQIEEEGRTQNNCEIF